MKKEISVKHIMKESCLKNVKCALEFLSASIDLSVELGNNKLTNENADTNYMHNFYSRQSGPEKQQTTFFSRIFASTASRFCKFQDIGFLFARTK